MSGRRSRSAIVDSDDSLFDSDFSADLSDMDLTTASPPLRPAQVQWRISPNPPRPAGAPRNRRPIVELPTGRPGSAFRAPSRDPSLSLAQTVDARRAQTGQARSSRDTAGTSMAAAIDLTGDDSDEDDPVVVGVAGPLTRPAQARHASWLGGSNGSSPERRQARPEMIAQSEFTQEMQNINRALDRRREETEALIEADQQDIRRRLVLSPPVIAPPAPRPRRIAQPNPRVGFGAVLRQGDQQINYGAGGRRQRSILPPLTVEANRFGRVLVQEGLPVPTGGVRRRGPAEIDAELRNLQRRQDDLMERLAAQRRRALNDEDGLWDDDPDDGDYDPENDFEDDVMNWDPPAHRRIARQVPPAPAPRQDQPRPGGLLARLAEGYRLGNWRNFPFFGGDADAEGLLQRIQAPALHAGPAAFGGRGPEGVSAILDRVTPFHFTPPPPGFTTDFEDPADKEPITLDDEGKVVKTTTKFKPYLSCAMCHDPLLNSSYYRSDDDRIWALRCGHLIDQKCLVKLSTPESAPETEPELPLGKRKKRRKVTRKVLPAVEHEYACPVAGCEGKCTSVLEDEKWEQKLGEGALVAFV